MGRYLLFVLIAALVLGLAGIMLLGVFPPGARTEQVQHVLPNDKFQPH